MRSSSARRSTIAPAFFRRLTRVLATVGPLPAQRALARLRAEAVERAIATHRDQADAIASCLHAGNAAARGHLADLAAQALHDMRAQVQRRAGEAGLIFQLCERCDALWADCQRSELLDDPSFDETRRTRLMSDLDELNHVLNSYEQFLEALLPFIHADRPTRILELAAGHGGFALAIASLARQRSLDLRITATDIKSEYLDLGANMAARAGLDIDFLVQDALDLTAIPDGAYDVIVCTQSLHHFPPGLVAVMFEAATRVAAQGVVLIDPCRSALGAAAVVLYSVLGMRNLPMAHDGWISLRKSFVPEELELLARIGSWGDRARACWLPPGHCLLRWARPDPGHDQHRTMAPARRDGRKG